MSKNIIITGGCGMIGKSLIKYLLKKESTNKIICIDNFISSNRLDFTEFIKKYNTNASIILYDFDITKFNLMDFMLNDINNKGITIIHEIYHLASLASPPFYKKYPIETMDVGYIGTKNILEIAKMFNSKLLFSSTSEVYGDAKETPQNENYYGNVNSFGERCSYDESKRIGEALCFTYIKKYNLDIKIARIFNTYGPGMLLNDGRIITEVIKNLMNNTTLSIFGDGKQTRSCCYVEDTVDMLVKLMDSNCNIPVNIGNDKERTINETVDIIEKVYNEYMNFSIDNYIKVKKQYKALTQNDPLQRKPCLKFNKQVLGEIKYTSFQEGIFNTIKYFKLYRGNNMQ
jgi:UDP-glucuronate decarboxylase